MRPSWFSASPRNDVRRAAWNVQQVCYWNWNCIGGPSVSGDILLVATEAVLRRAERDFAYLDRYPQILCVVQKLFRMWNTRIPNFHHVLNWTAEIRLLAGCEPVERDVCHLEIPLCKKFCFVERLPVFQLACWWASNVSLWIIRTGLNDFIPNDFSCHRRGF